MDCHLLSTVTTLVSGLCVSVMRSSVASSSCDHTFFFSSFSLHGIVTVLVPDRFFLFPHFIVNIRDEFVVAVRRRWDLSDLTFMSHVRVRLDDKVSDSEYLLRSRSCTELLYHSCLDEMFAIQYNDIPFLQ
jgi:hypothetical protein